MADEPVLLGVADRIATITLNRPERLNAIDDAMAEALWAAMDRAGRDPGVRAIVLTGAGRAFCAGGNIAGFDGMDPQHLVTKQRRPFDMNRRPDYQTRHSLFPAIGKPIIAMLNGPVAGLGLLYALFCDIRFMNAEAVATTAFARLGLAAEYGMAWILRETVGHANALDLLLSARKVTGSEALLLGLVQRVCAAEALVAETYAYAGDLAANCSPNAMRLLKQEVWEAPFQSLHEAVMLANRDMIATNASDDFKEGVASFRAKRAPRFADPV